MPPGGPVARRKGGPVFSLREGLRDVGLRPRSAMPRSVLTRVSRTSPPPPDEVERRIKRLDKRQEISFSAPGLGGTTFDVVEGRNGSCKSARHDRPPARDPGWPEYHAGQAADDWGSVMTELASRQETAQQDAVADAEDARGGSAVVSARLAKLEAEVAAGIRSAASLVAVPRELVLKAELHFPVDAFGEPQDW